MAIFALLLLPATSTTWHILCVISPGGKFWPNANGMEKGGAVLKGKNPEIPIESELAHSIVTAGLETLQNDPYGLVVNVSEVSDWVENGGKEKEIALTQRP